MAVIVITFNEAANLPLCLGSVSELGCPIYVVDSGSSDGTPEIARRFGAEVLTHPFRSHTEQWQWALEHTPAKGAWVLGLDADQRLTASLRDELVRLFSRDAQRLEGIDGWYINRRQVFRGRWIRHGGYYPKYLLKLFHRDRVVFDAHDLVDHHFYVRGATARLQSDLVEENRKEDRIAFWIEKHNRYATLTAREELARRGGRAAWAIRPRLFGSADQRTVWLKERWYGLPLYVRPVLYFLYRYVLRRGFLDGRQGLIFHVLHAFWYRLLVDVNLEELLTPREDPPPGPAAPPARAAQRGGA